MMLDFERFKNPPKSARPMVRWWWTGTDVEKDELLREVAELDEAGFLGAEIQAFMTGSPPNLKETEPERHRRSHRFMQPYYYRALKAVLDEGARRDMVFDLTVCSGWPAGGAHVAKEDSMKVLLIGTKVLKGGRRYVGPVPRFKKPFFYTLIEIAQCLGLLKGLLTFCRNEMRLIRVVAAKPIGKPGRVRSFRPKAARLDIESAVDLSDKVDETGNLEWNVPQGTWQIFAFYAGPSGAQPSMDSRVDPEAESLVLDHMAREPIDKHLEHHLGRGWPYLGRHLGRTLRAFFTDSLELIAEWIWTDDFLNEFQRRRGYDLAPYLPVNYVPSRDNKFLSVLLPNEKPCFDFEGDLGQRIRHDFEQTVSDLFTERFAQAMTDWANANNLQSRIQAYGVRVDTLKTYGVAHIPETEQLFAGGMLDFLRLAGSAGLIYDKPLVTAEAMVWNQRDYLTTPLKWKVAADRLFVAGINQMIYHGFPYQQPSFAYPGFDAFSSPYLPVKLMCYASNFARVNPFWEFFPALNAYVTRCQFVLQQGRTVSNIGLYYPLFNYPDAVLQQEELVGGYLDEYDAPLARFTINGRPSKNLDGEERWMQAQVRLANGLVANGYSYVHLNPESLLRGRVEDGKLVVGSARLEALVLAHVERITVEVAAKLQTIARAGIPVLFVGQVPDKQTGFHNYRENDAIVSSITAELSKRYGNVLRTGSDLPIYLADKLGVQPNLRFDEPQPTVHYIHKRTDKGDFYFLRHAAREPLTVSMRFSHVTCVPYLLDPWSGQVSPAAQYEVDEDAVRMEVHFPGYGSTLIAFCPTDDMPHVLHGNLPVSQESGVIVAYTAEAGDYAFLLNDGSSRWLRVARDVPPMRELNAWHLQTELRDHEGTVRPVHLDLRGLTDWRHIPELRYCSSKGIYSTRITIDQPYLQEGLSVTLDLGRVHDAAMVEVNGHELQPLLVYPFAVDVSPHLKAGENEIRVTVTPTLRNRLIGYGKTGGKDWKQFKGRKEFAPSGLIGPVRLIPKWRLEIQPPRPAPAR